MSENYIRNNFSDIKNYADVIEKRLDDSDCTVESVIEDNGYFLSLAEKYNKNYILIDEKWEPEKFI